MEKPPEAICVCVGWSEGANARCLLGALTHPRGEVGFGFKVFAKVLVPFEVAQVGLQGEGSQQEVGLLPLDALREQHLFPQVPVVVVPGGAVTENIDVALHVSQLLGSRDEKRRPDLPDQAAVLHVILSSEVDDHRRAKLVDSLSKAPRFILFQKDEFHI